MAKYAKKIDTAELSSTIIGKVKSKRASLIPLFLVIAIFMSSIYFVDDILGYASKYLGINLVDKDPSDTPVIPVTPKDLFEVAYASNVSIVNPNLPFSITNLVAENGKIAYTVENTSKEEVKLDNYNYFLEFYALVEDSEGKITKQFLVRNLLDKDTIAVGEKKNYSHDFSALKVDYSRIKKVSLVNRKEIDYTPSNDELVVKKNLIYDDILTMGCTKGNDTVYYNFTTSKTLTQISNEFTVPAEEYNEDDYFDYRGNVEGYNIEVSDDGNNKLINITVDLTLAKKRLQDKYYLNGTYANIISYEMEARGYSCE